MPSRRADIRIGISGWRYPRWRGQFYPKGLTQKRELEYASRQFNALELNGSFYSLQRPESYRQWRQETPDDFLFAIKGGRFITHMKKLKDVKVPLANFFASGLLALEEKLGPILWQLPPNLGFHPERLEAFFDLLPRDTRAAARLARNHDERLAGRALTRTKTSRPLRHALEVRHESFRSKDFYALLRRHQIALVIADTAGKWPFLDEVTTDFVYARLHGDSELYTSGYDDKSLDAWATRIKKWTRGRSPKDVFVFFDNDAKVRAPFDAMALMRRVGSAA